MKSILQKSYCRLILFITILTFCFPLCCCLGAAAGTKTDIAAAPTCCENNSKSFTNHVHECSCGCSLEADVPKSYQLQDHRVAGGPVHHLLKLTATSECEGIPSLSQKRRDSNDPPIFILNCVFRC